HREVGMAAMQNADVIAVVDRERTLDLRCLEAVLERSGPILNRLIVVDDHGTESEVAAELGRFAGRDHRVLFVSDPNPHAPVSSGMPGWSLREGDAVILAWDCLVAAGWLEELAAVAHSEERTACASPLTNVGGPCSVPELNRYRDAEALEEEVVRAACAG